MTVSGISSHTKMSRKKSRSSGWAAFDLNQRQREGLNLDFDVDPYPPMLHMTATVAPSGNSMLRNVPSVKSFSSVLQPKMDFPILIDNDSKRQLLDGIFISSSDNKVVKENNTVRAIEKLKELHGWADISLIEDILAAVNNNFDQASTQLKSMVMSSSSEENKTVDLAELKAVIQHCLDDKKPEQMDEVICENKLSNCTTDINLVSRPLMSLDAEEYVISIRSSDNMVVKENNTVRAIEKLKELHGWADNSLIEDILAAVNNNFDQASTQLKSMVTSSSSEENKTVDLAKLKAVIWRCLDDKKPEQMDEGVICENKLSKCTTDVNLVSRPLMSLPAETEWEEDDLCLNHRNDDIKMMTPLKGMVASSSSEENKAVDLAELKAFIQRCLDDKKPEQMDEGVIFENKLSNGTTDIKLVSWPLMSLPAEPEWEEDDVYLNHRKDAIRMIRSASQHSGAATNAYLKGDHFSAQQLSHKAREEWRLAEQLNAKAAEEILTIRNSKNNIWKLDLHGLHACEAMHALQKHLQKIETQMHLNRAVPPKKVKTKVGIACPPLVETHSCKGMEVKAGVQNYTLSSERQAMLEVITGKGNHSRGEAVLPSAIRSFLLENGYRFDEVRPGVILVHPKFGNR